MTVSSKVAFETAWPHRDHEGFVRVGAQEMYRIPQYDRLDPFLISITSESDLWMYVSSAGGVTAGRVDADHALFPYESDDHLHRAYGISGPATLVKIHRSGQSPLIWEPLAPHSPEPGPERNLYKTALGSFLMFEEIHRRLRLTFRYSWTTSARFGFVRTATLVNEGDAPVRLEVLDGLLNILPAGAHLAMQRTLSPLVDAYKHNELDSATKLAIYHLTAVVTDRPEPSEVLTATTVWSRGLAGAAVLLREEARDDFRQGRHLAPAWRVAGRRGAFLLQAPLELAGGETIDWDIVCDVEQDHVEVARTRKLLRGDEEKIRQKVRQNVHRSGGELVRIVAEADGLQISRDRMACARHAANVLFNAMRGGAPLRQGKIQAAEFRDFVRERNLSAFTARQAILVKLPETMEIAELIALMDKFGGGDLTRLAYEYLPLFFSRRHGDPSRPWNVFSIRLRNTDGSARLGYEGNWRDIFQNWEALALPFPELIEGFIAKFVNASTVDGFNPYRIGSEGIDWEVPDPDDRWSHIGYWGDHQIDYLLKLLELSRDFHPGRLRSLLGKDIFGYAEVPYRLDSYDAIMRNPRQTIHWDASAAAKIDRRVAAGGFDGKLLHDASGNVYHATLLEKLLVPLLSKLSNLVPGGGIWMNTQRPEWNDANNALPGCGVSVVTLAHLRGYLGFLAELLEPMAGESCPVSTEVIRWAQDLSGAMRKRQRFLSQHQFSDNQRRSFLDEAGMAFERYRTDVYAKGFSGKESLPVEQVLELVQLASRFVDHSLAVNRRDDGLFHSYNMLVFSAKEQGIGIRHLQEMLEGQVAILCSGVLDGKESMELLSRLFKGRLYRHDQRSFMLYPVKELPGFFEKNVVPAEAVENSPLLSALVAAEDRTIIACDADGIWRFDRSFQTDAAVKRALQRLSAQEQWRELVALHEQEVLDLYAEVFDHGSFTGRSGTMYAYEGIGCIYWHMVSKLLLAAQECFWRAIDGQAPAAQIDMLAELYYRIRAGLEYEKTALEYGAFPTDPHSHTPMDGGARQPGMTGRVKEEILTRLGEWGVRIRGGAISFDPRLLRRDELLSQRQRFSFVALDGAQQSIDLDPGMAAFTLCQTPVVYQTADRQRGVSISVHRCDGSVTVVESDEIDPSLAKEIFQRRGTVRRLDVRFNPSVLLKLPIRSFPGDDYGDTRWASLPTPP